MSLIPVAPLESFAGSSFQKVAGLVDLGRETFLIWKGEFVFARQNLIRQSLQRVLSNRVIFLGAQDQANRRILVRLRPMFPSVIEIKMHLTRISMRELADLQINDYKAPQFAVKEKKIDAIPFAADAQPALATDEGKVAAELEQELLKVPQERFFKVALRIFVFQPEEFENERIAHFIIGGD